jgi:23S rRNA (adenine2503-C2)-methyltransferase
MKNILDFEYDSLVPYIEEIGLEKYRTDQILNWIYDKKTFSFDEMTNLSKEQRNLLSEKLCIAIPKLVKKEISTIDRTTKYLWELKDGERIESVVLYYPDRISACISTQVGCPCGCSFCATGQSGFKRNLSSGEIVSQILAMEREEKVRISNIVYMGMGEPFLNYDNTLSSVRMLNHKKMKNVGARHITISTVGITDKIIQLAKENLDLRLAISIHASSDKKRDQIIPMNKKYSLREIAAASKIYQEKTGRRVTLEYILIKGFNDYPQDASDLAELFKGVQIYVNLIPVNPVEDNLVKPSFWMIGRFRDTLEKNGVECEVRREKGTDINAACGQLRRRTGGDYK